MKKIIQKTILKATPHEIYEMLMDSEKHSKFTEQKAKISRELNGKFTAFEGWVEGENIELVSDKKIVQKWRGKDWEKGVYSKVTFVLKEVSEGTEIILTHENIPDDCFDSVNKGWKEHYWDKMKKYLEKNI